MHILIISSEPFFSRNDSLSGIFQLDQAKALKKAGFKVGIISPNINSVLNFSFKNLTSDFKICSKTVDQIKILTKHSYNFLPKIPYSDITFWKKAGIELFKKYVSENGKPDIIHAHNTIYAGLLGIRIKELFNIPVIVTEHSSGFWRNLYTKNQLKEAARVIRKFDRLIVVSDALGKEMQRVAKSPNLTYQYIPNVLDEIFVKNSSNLALKNPSDTFRFLNIGYLNKNKGQHHLIEAFAKNFHDIKATLVIVGKGEEETNLKQLVSKLKMEGKIKFRGQISRKEILDEIISCNAFVLSSLYETFGVVLIEALACGKPIIATRSGGPENIVNEKNGILVQTNNIQELGEAMQYIFRNEHNYDPKLIREECLALYNSNAILSELEKIYFSVISKGNI